MDGNAQEFSTHAEELVDKYAKLVYQLASARTRSREATGRWTPAWTGCPHSCAL